MRVVIDNHQYIEIVGNPGKPTVAISNLRNEDPTCEEDVEWNQAVDVIESLVLAHFCAGVDVRSEAYRKGLSVSLEALETQIA